MENVPTPAGDEGCCACTVHPGPAAEASAVVRRSGVPPATITASGRAARGPAACALATASQGSEAREQDRLSPGPLRRVGLGAAGFRVGLAAVRCGGARRHGVGDGASSTEQIRGLRTPHEALATGHTLPAPSRPCHVGLFPGLRFGLNS